MAAAGCSDIDPFDSTSTTAPSRHRPDDANDADVEFLKGMIDQLQSGKALTGAALDSRTNAGDDVPTLAAHIEDEDAGRVDKMTELLSAWSTMSGAVPPRTNAIRVGCSTRVRTVQPRSTNALMTAWGGGGGSLLGGGLGSDGFDPRPEYRSSESSADRNR